MKFPIKDLFSNYYQIRRKQTGDMVTFTEEILNGKLYFLHSIGSIKFVFSNVDLNLFAFFNFNLADLISLIYKI